jgi:hypothetical protein
MGPLPDSGFNVAFGCLVLEHVPDLETHFQV